MQRCVRSEVGGATDNEGYVAEAEGFGASVVGTVEVVAGVFGRSHEPEEGGDAEIDDVDLHGTERRVVGVKFACDGFEDGDVSWIGSGGRFVFLLEGGHVISEYGIVVFGSRSREAGIWFTQVGEPLSDGREDLRYGVSPDIVLTPPGALTVSVDVDDEVVELVVWVEDVLKSRVSADGVAEVDPAVEVLAGGSPGSRDIGRRGGLERRAEVSREASSGGSVRSRQGLACG